MRTRSFAVLGMTFFSVAALFVCGRAAWGAGAILVDTESTGLPVVWQNGLITYNPESGDEGTLGQLTNEEALDLLDELFQDWAGAALNGVASAALTIQEGAGLGGVDSSNVDEHFTYCPPTSICPGEDPPFVLGSARTGASPILFDADGQITDRILGTGARRSVLGFAGPRVVERTGGILYITESQAVFNGLFVNCPEGSTDDDPCQSPEVAMEEFEGAIFHELGHFIGIDHTQVNLGSAVKALNGDDSEIEAITTMLPLFIDGAAQRTPHYDDLAAVSMLYPSAAFASEFCTISGTVFESDGTTALQGVNVVARNAGNTLLEATSFVSGSYYTGTFTDCDAQVGGYTLSGIRPGESYSIETQKVSPSFTGGSSLEPCDPPLSGFDADALAGTFSCDSGGETITLGTVTTTNVITNKQSSTAVDDDSGAGGSGCSLMPAGE